MSKKSVFDPNNSDSTGRSGLDRFSPPPAQSYSQLPDQLTDGETEENDSVDPALARQLPQQCSDNADALKAIEDAVDERNEGASR